VLKFQRVQNVEAIQIGTVTQRELQSFLAGVDCVFELNGDPVTSGRIYTDNLGSRIFHMNDFIVKVEDEIEGVYSEQMFRLNFPDVEIS
jgi:hypothetical protein